MGKRKCQRSPAAFDCRGLPARDRKPESRRITGHSRRCNQNDRGNTVTREADCACDVRIALSVSTKCLGKEEFSLRRVGRILAAECGAEERYRIRPVGKHQSPDSDRQCTIAFQ